MDINTIITLTGSLGFPIAITIFLLWYVQQREEKNDEKERSITESHNIIIEKLIDAVNNNTKAINDILKSN